MVVVSRKLDTMYHIQPGLGPGTCGVRIHSTICSPTAASSFLFIFHSVIFIYIFHIIHHFINIYEIHILFN